MIDNPDQMAEYAARSGVIPATSDKPWWQSRAIIGVIISSLSVAVGMAGYELNVGAATEIVAGLGALVGNALAWYGRVKATKPISRRQVLPGVAIKGNANGL